MRERGQATVEWIGLVLALALAFAGALTVAGGARFDAPAHRARAIRPPPRTLPAPRT